MLPLSLHAALLVFISALQFANGWRFGPPKVDLRSEPTPVRRLLPNANRKLAHVVEDVRSTSTSSSTSSSSTLSSSTSKHPLYGTGTFNGVPLGTGTGLPGIPSPPLVTVVSIRSSVTRSSIPSLSSSPSSSSRSTTGFSSSSSTSTTTSSTSSSNTPPIQTPLIQPVQESSPSPPPPPPPPSPPPSPPQTLAINPRSGELGGGTIPSNPSNVVTSLLCGEAFQASHQYSSWANYGTTMKIIKDVSVRQARFGDTARMREEAGECAEVECQGGSGILWCSENDGPVEVDRMFSVLWGANYILEECYPFVNREDEKEMKKVQVAGQVFFAGGWSVLVKGGEC